MNSGKTISANSQGIIVYHGENNKHHFVNYKFMNDQQLHGSSFKGRSYQDNDIQQEKLSRNFNQTQTSLYKKSLYGLGEYSEKELRSMSEFEKLLIERKQKALWAEINIWKNQQLEYGVNHLLTTVFHKSSLIKELFGVAPEKGSLNKPNRMSFHELGLDRSTVAKKMISLGYLTQEFFELA
jgi:hypothetical protein